MHIHVLARPILGQQCARARFHSECAERGASRIGMPGQRSRRARDYVSGQRQSQDGGAAAPARKAGLKESDAAAEYVTADGDPIQATHVWRHSMVRCQHPPPAAGRDRPARGWLGCLLPAAPFDRAVPIEDSVHGTDRRAVDIGAALACTDLRSTPGIRRCGAVKRAGSGDGALMG
jgi:hypothetical protein